MAVRFSHHAIERFLDRFDDYIESLDIVYMKSSTLKKKDLSRMRLPMSISKGKTYKKYLNCILVVDRKLNTLVTVVRV